MITDMLLWFIVITWTTIIIFQFINSWITASQYNWWKLRGYKEGQICLLLTHFTIGISIWLNVLNRELGFVLFPYLFISGILFFLLWIFGFRVIHSKALYKKLKIKNGKNRRNHKTN
jgi:hypothetical protein